MNPRPRFLVILLACLLPAFTSLPSLAEDGYRLWLRYEPLPSAYAELAAPFTGDIILATPQTPLTDSAVSELQRGLSRLLPGTGAGETVMTTEVEAAGIMLLTPEHLPPGSPDDIPFNELGDEGFALRQADLNGHPLVIIAANTDRGLLYGAFGLLQHLQLEKPLTGLDEAGTPAIDLRVLNHWDNLDRSVERGYAGQSLWDWWRLPDYIDPRYTDYARANASLGINGTVLNNVNSNALILTPDYLGKVAALADVFRPWGIRVYLSARFSAPREIGGLPTADPLDPAVQQWWQNKVDDIYELIPDFGGFLVKANSEGQPGPQDYGRSHADGANMLGKALEPHGGVVMWRAFVYSDVDPEDRAKQAWSEFVPLDGDFVRNVLVQAKNGAIDFQPREPFHPLFGAMPDTPLMMEFQITKEYLGFATHLAYLGPLFEEVLKARIVSEDEAVDVASVVDGSLHDHALTGIAGVAGIGNDRDWLGSDFNQANWYAYGRLAWNPRESADAIARDWLALTFSDDPVFLDTAGSMMRRSREAVVDYMTPLGLAHLMGTGHHYGPAPWVSELGRPEWNPVYYHRADENGIGFDRTATGSNALAQYAPLVARSWNDPATMDERFLLWFHHLPWDFRVQSGLTLWEELVARYDRGVAEVEAMVEQWNSLESHVDAERFTRTRQLLAIQLNEARWWRDASLAYWQSINGLPLPAGVRAPEHTLDYYKSLRFPNAPG